MESTVLDAYIALAYDRDWFNEDEIEKMFNKLIEEGIENHDITGPLIDKLRARTPINTSVDAEPLIMKNTGGMMRNINGQAVANTFLDLRNQFFPYVVPEVVPEPEPKEVAV